MTREIIFRGKRIDNGEWVEGFYVHENTTTLQTEHHVIFSGNNDYSDQTGSDRYESWWVDPDTVGQYTGMKANGKRIFEGDIVAACFRNNYSLQKFKVNFADGMFLFDNSCVRVPRRDIYGVQIIGNVHDNPELIGGNDGTTDNR